MLGVIAVAAGDLKGSEVGKLGRGKDSDLVVCGMRVAGSGGGAVNECVGGADSTLMIGTAENVEAETAPFSRLTRFRLTAFP